MLYNVLKRLVDIGGSLFGLIILSPLLFLVALAIKLDSEGPVMADTPARSGKDGKLFKIYKFRSMVQNAHEILEKNPKLLEEYKKNSYKIFNDPRVTRVGKFIRKYSIDEFPQFFNILKGDMSLVGPRAYYPYELEEQQKNYPASRKYVKVILSGKPGLTGVWQVTGRSEINFDKRVQMDADYVKRKSILYDFWIMAKTIPAVISGRGAV
ncbi:MAG: Undecaprenyl-phosphate galactose phosphotransferase [Candidatus Daviesbacteria bacterium GW2011_GWC2_40_12]|uniref:Undecaprenyl-phosphate galactose phosphotransferase n=1 Tax=Candidatus Daviesbacteria bacterium GW2011_GWC2_40_12 TaxID=1618431 RepID=A0A0G0QQL0_9BACT|nr:MAG: Undecaprenyl-phosphate galactose phosphotransferase [Candidatus Daviesbacteria bacterium GW2011_GWA2_39_33]KKR42719.1 MAG: Undecaprenyl-phosphate galactose phosphotransferase [Candidatus Daviesbacteria bacterium GW2011_GWC2_40_12]